MYKEIGIFNVKLGEVEIDLYDINLTIGNLHSDNILITLQEPNKILINCHSL